MRKVILAAAAAFLVGSPVVAAAASLGLTTQDLAAGSAPVTACDNGFTYAYTTVGGNVTAVTVGGIADPECSGGEFSLTLTNASGARLGSGGPATVPSDGDTADDSLNVSIAALPDADLVAGVRVAIAGS
jgi:hypothetical protein